MFRYRWGEAPDEPGSVPGWPASPARVLQEGEGRGEVEQSAGTPIEFQGDERMPQSLPLNSDH